MWPGDWWCVYMHQDHWGFLRRSRTGDTNDYSCHWCGRRWLSRRNVAHVMKYTPECEKLFDPLWHPLEGDS